MSDYITSPQAIETRSFEIITEELGTHTFNSEAEARLIKRIIHTTADFEFARLTHFSAGAIEAGMHALRNGAHIVTDTRMAAAGLPMRRLTPLGVTVTPIMALPGLDDLARAKNTTRSRAGLESLAGQMSGHIMVIGNAPTALLGLLDVLDQGAPPPALIVGMPVGFVNAAQSKELLRRSPWPHFTLLGRKGGSAVAAACVNALADLALEQCGLGDVAKL